VSKPERIRPVFVERVWGRRDLSPFFGVQDRPIGEVWFPVGPDFPLLVKFIFTDERLSVQVHPDDAYAREHENSRGKSEMWHILEARPASTIALGFRTPVSKQQLRDSIAQGTVAELLEWVPVRAGDTLLAPAGTVHAIGAGITLCEIQQNSDVTYRLFDYGRPRELHVERGLAVARTAASPGVCTLPVESEHFTTDIVSAPGVSDLPGAYLLIAIAGCGTLGGQRFEAGETWFVPESAGPVEVVPEAGARLLRTGSS
jgi:mannose-6-phosphate isomerase